jgi:hypothetical protein
MHQDVHGVPDEGTQPLKAASLLQIRMVRPLPASVGTRLGTHGTCLWLSPGHGVKMTPVEAHDLVPVAHDAAGDRDLMAAATRLGDLYERGQVSLEEFYRALERIFTASGSTDLEGVMRALPPPVQLTPMSLRLTEPLVLRIPDGGARLGAGWQLGAITSVTTSVGTTQLDLNAATWDALDIDLHLETWGSIEVLIPRGVAVQMAGGSGRVQIHPLSPPIPGGPVLRIRISGPSGVICVGHLEERPGGPFTRRRQRRDAKR